jgi:small subunit ribosomal protein S1
VLVRHSRRFEAQEFPLHGVVTGVVQNVTNYGAFVDMDSTTGLVHISQISHERLTSADQVFKVMC